MTLEHSGVPGLDEALCTSILELAATGPFGANPRVGAALLSSDGHLLALGHHRGAGTAHAEVDAISRARAKGHSLHGATCIVTLEPCAHEGRTPSCAKTLIDEGINTVIYALADPHAHAAGGATLLRDAGISVLAWRDVFSDAVGRELTQRARHLNHRWFAAKTEGRPFVTAKIAHTLDAKVAAANGTSMWITGAEARAEGHALRSIVDAIMVGSGTLVADDPSLTARTPTGTLAPHQPLRVVMGTSPVPAHAKVRGADGAFLHLPTRDFATALRTLAQVHKVEHLLLEGGPTLIGAALRANLIDDLWIHYAPTVLGAGTPSIPPVGITDLSERCDFEIAAHTLHLAGRDLLFHAIPTARATEEENQCLPE